MTELIDIEIATFQADCKNCGHKFDFPSFGDFAYGRFIFNTEDGKSFVYYDFSTSIDLLFKVMLPENPSAELYQTALAEFSDPVFFKKVKRNIHCPKCTSVNLNSFHGIKTGSMWVKPVTYHQLNQLKRSEIIQRFVRFVDEKNA